MAIVTGDRYLGKLVKFVEEQAGPLIEGTKVLKLNPVGLHYVYSRLEALHELEMLLAGAPVDYLRAYVSDLGDHRALEQLRRMLRLLTSLKVVSVFPPSARDPTPLSLLPFGRLKILELRGCDLSTSAAKGLLELRHTLEKIICHNSTDALRHVFASRIAEIKDSPQWNRLSFVSCACNRLVLMDESLQLLPAVETLDLSRNKFAKVGNLRKYTKLKHLDLGFNRLRTVSYFSEVSCPIVKLVLRNNALTTLRGLENLKSLEGLDISYNIISNYSELEFLTGLLSLRSLWLEGNPICCASWYRPQVFSYFAYPDKLKLDDKEICNREFWKRQIIIASRQTRPASFGFYFPAKNDAGRQWNINTKKKKVSRLACIESEEESTYACSDEESTSFESEIRNQQNNLISDDGSEISDLINKVEHMKKERSILWLREFKEWMDHSSENFIDVNYNNSERHPDEGNSMKRLKNLRHRGESSRHVSVLASLDESSTNMSYSDNSFVDTTIGPHSNFDHNGSLGYTTDVSLRSTRGRDPSRGFQKSFTLQGISSMSMGAENFHGDTLVMEGQREVENGDLSPLSAINGTTESQSSYAYPGSPPHYQKDILHRRRNLVEEYLQLSAGSYSLASSDSKTSCSDDGIPESEQLVLENESVNQEHRYRNNEHDLSSGACGDTSCDQRGEIPCCLVTGAHLLGALNPRKYIQLCNNELDVGDRDGEVSSVINNDWLEKRKSRKKLKRRVVCLLDKKNDGIRETFDVEREQVDNGQICKNGVISPQIDDAVGSPRANSSTLGRVDFIVDYFIKNVADSKTQETCVLCMRCDSLLDLDSTYREREVALLMSSENKLYVLLVNGTFDGSGTVLRLLGQHKIEDVKEVFVGLGLQVVRIHIDERTSYFFITRSIERSVQLLQTLQLDSQPGNANCVLRSLEQVQVELFEKQICGGLKLSIFQYIMVLFWCSDGAEGSWLARSLFVTGGYVVVCVEDIMQFNSPSMDASSSPYFSLDSCCSIADISEVVIEKNLCLTIAVKCTISELTPSTTVDGSSDKKKKENARSVTWKLRCFSEESQSKFLSLLKATHRESSKFPLLVRGV